MAFKDSLFAFEQILKTIPFCRSELQAKPEETPHFGLRRALSRALSTFSGGSESSGYDEGDSDVELLSPTVDSARSLHSYGEGENEFLKLKAKEYLEKSGFTVTKEEPTKG